MEGGVGVTVKSEASSGTLTYQGNLPGSKQEPGFSAERDPGMGVAWLAAGARKVGCPAL